MNPLTPTRRTQAALTLGLGALFGLCVLAWGPLLPWTVERLRAEPQASGAPERLYLCARAERALGKGEAARRTLEVWLELYAREDGRDWGPLLSGETRFVMRKYAMGEGIHERGFAPWALQPSPSPGSAPSVRPVSDALLGRVLLDYVEVLEDAKEYPKAAHVVVCLLHLWPQDSEVWCGALDAFKRGYGGRSF